jgi:anthranilate synthase component 1
VISYSEVKAMALRGNVIPLSVRVPSDLETPVSAFMKLATGKKYSFLLESIEGGEKLARYSFIGFDPFLVIRGEVDRVVVHKDGRTKEIDAPPVELLKHLFDVYRPVKLPDLPRFTGGGVGYFAYDTARWVERIPDNNKDSIGLPEMILGLYATILAFDHLKQEIVVIANILHDHQHPGLQKKYREAKARIEKITSRLKQPLRVPHQNTSRRKTEAKPLTTRKDFEARVRRARKYIKEGDIFQVVLSQRWQVDSVDSSLEVYRRLRRINPSPYMFLLNFGDDAIIGSSPEMMVRIEGCRIETRPIAGTRPRGKDEAEDILLIADLLSDPKELAEHTMLIDLGRNDIGRVSRPGTVNVEAQMTIEKYSHVIHIVSSVAGKLQSRCCALDGLFACAPAGTVSGAPKVRAMEIIDELEQHRRGVYAGTVAYLDFWGNLDSCIAIRTIVKRAKSYFVQAGAGIVADSVPRREFAETEAKARALIKAVTGNDCL